MLILRKSLKPKLMNATITTDIMHIIIDIFVCCESYPPIVAALNIFPIIFIVLY